MDEYKLHSRGENWFHFREKMDSLMQSFTITYCHDGSVCMTGDMGCLVWQREYFPKVPDYGFPFEGTGIGYFAEKVVRAEECQKIKDWNRQRAISEIEADIIEYSQEDGHEKNVVAMKEVLDRMDFFEDNEHGYHEMLEAFMDAEHSIEGEVYCE